MKRASLRLVFHVATVLVVAVVAAGCATATVTRNPIPSNALTPDAPAVVLRLAQPADHTLEEIGSVHVEGGIWIGPADAESIARSEARDIGADVVIVLREGYG